MTQPTVPADGTAEQIYFLAKKYTYPIAKEVKQDQRQRGIVTNMTNFDPFFAFLGHIFGVKNIVT